MEYNRPYIIAELHQVNAQVKQTRPYIFSVHTQKAEILQTAPTGKMAIVKEDAFNGHPIQISRSHVMLDHAHQK